MPLRVRNSLMRSVPAQWSRSDKHDVAGASRNQFHSTMDEGPQ